MERHYGFLALKNLNFRGRNRVTFFDNQESLMALFSLLGASADPLFDDMLIWLVALLAGSIGVVSLINVLDMLTDADVG